MGSTLGSQKSVNRGEKRPYCRFTPPAPPKTRDLDPSSYLPNSLIETVWKIAEGVLQRGLFRSVEGKTGLLCASFRSAELSICGLSAISKQFQRMSSRKPPGPTPGCLISREKKRSLLLPDSP